MTLALAVTGPESIWLLADRRLSYEARAPKDDGHKVMFLETADGVAILGYAGLGATAKGTEPADWMSAALRGRNLSLEQSLGVLSRATREQFPQHMVRMPANSTAAHHVIVPAFLDGEPRLYTIDLVFAPDRKSYQFRYTRHVASRSPGIAPRTPRLGLGGSGAFCLTQDRKWMRELLRVVRANERGQVSPDTVADFLANLNNDVHLTVPDKSVGPRCIVAWRYRKGGVHDGGGGHRYYTGPVRDRSSPSLPTISRGADLNAIVEAIAPQAMKRLEAMLKGEPTEDLDIDETNAALARLPREPDEKLR